MKADPEADLLPGEWAVLGLLSQEPAHGFAIARSLSPTGAFGRIWLMSRPRVYRAIDDLEARGLIAPVGTAPSERGPTRTLYEATGAGQARLDAWLRAPVGHVREMRSDLLLKLAILHERRMSPRALLDAQRDVLAPVLRSLESAISTATGFESVVLRYRLESTRSALTFIDQIRALEIPYSQGAS